MKVYQHSVIRNILIRKWRFFVTCLCLNFSFGIIIKGSTSIHARKDLPRGPQQDSGPIPRSNKERSALVGPDLGRLLER